MDSTLANTIRLLHTLGAHNEADRLLATAEQSKAERVRASRSASARSSRLARRVADTCDHLNNIGL